MQRIECKHNKDSLEKNHSIVPSLDIRRYSSKDVGFMFDHFNISVFVYACQFQRSYFMKVVLETHVLPTEAISCVYIFY